MKYVFYLSHGINTDESESSELESNFTNIMQENFPKVDYVVWNGSYGFINSIINVIPFIRNLLILKVKNDLINIQKAYPDREIILITYSYGTYLMSKVLLNNSFLIDKWVLFGGVLHCKFDFSKLQSRVDAVLNFCSLEDEVARFAPKIFDYGNCGAYGFRYANGDKANTDIYGKEKVQIGYYLNCKAVYNFHYNNVEHSGKSGWFHSDTYIKEAVKLSLE